MRSARSSTQCFDSMNSSASMPSDYARASTMATVALLSPHRGRPVDACIVRRWRSCSSARAAASRRSLSRRDAAWAAQMARCRYWAVYS